MNSQRRRQKNQPIHSFQFGQLKSQKGSVLMMLMAALPLLLTTLMFIISTTFVSYYYQTQQSACRQGLLRLQNQMATSLNSLLKLNKTAKRLRRQARMARRSLKLAAHPGAVVGATGALVLIRAQQMLLRAKQYSYIQSGQRKARKILRETRQLLENNNFFKSLNNKLIVKTRTKTGIVKLLVFPKPMFSLSPSYHTVPLFSWLQRQTLSWELSLNRVFPDWIKSYLPALPTLRGQCKATLRKEKKKWIETLTVDKF